MRCSSAAAAMLLVMAFIVDKSRAYDFTNLNLSNFTTTDAGNGSDKLLADMPPFEASSDRAAEHTAAPITSASQTPLHWILSRLYGGSGEKLNRTERSRILNDTQSAILAKRQQSKEPFEAQSQTDVVSYDEEAIRYNVSYLGLKDPFARYSTRLSYDYSIDISEPHDNRRGSMLSLLNGTVFPSGSVGAMMALGWSGTSNDTSRHKHAAAHFESANATGHATSSSPPTTPPLPDSSQSHPSALKAHGEGLSGVWLAFTSQHAVTGGYTLLSSRVSATNNIVFHNVTFRSNITIDAQGHFTFTFTMGTVDESDQDDSVLAANTATSTANGTHSSSFLNMYDQQDSFDERRRVREEHRRRGSKPTWLDGPRCAELDAIANNTEAAFRMRCEGFKVDVNEL